MANTIKIKRGLSANIDSATLEQGELAVTTDTHDLYVGTDSGKAKLGGGLKNILDGEADNSIRTLGSEVESDSYKLGHHAFTEGNHTKASGSSSHAEGDNTTASGDYSHVEGFYTVASGVIQHAQGKYNILDTTSAHIIGNGASDGARSNAHTIDWSGNAWFAGDVYTGSTSGTNKDAGSKKLATEEYVNSKTPTFQFQLYDTICTAEYGMTFEDWVNSSYNPDGGFSLNSSSQLVDSAGYTFIISTVSGFYLGQAANTTVLGTTYIVPFCSYTTPPCCFASGTQILLDNLGNTENIEKLKEGDKIIIYNEDTGEFEESSISKVSINEHVVDQATITLVNEKVIVMNAYHPLLTTEGYKSLTQHEGLPLLTKEDTLITTNGEVKIKTIERTTIEPTKMYNLTVAHPKYHNFVANSIVVHNARCPVKTDFN